MTQRNNKKIVGRGFQPNNPFNMRFGNRLTDVPDFNNVPFAEPGDIRPNIQSSVSNTFGQVSDLDTGNTGKVENRDHSNSMFESGGGVGNNWNLSSSSEMSSREAKFGAASSSKSDSSSGGSGNGFASVKARETGSGSGSLSVFQESSAEPGNDLQLSSAIAENSTESGEDSDTSSRREEIFDGSESGFEPNPTSGITDQDMSDGETEASDELLEIEDEAEPMDPHNQRPNSPVKVDKLVFQVLKRLDNPNGTSCRSVKKYLKKNCDVNVEAVNREIKECLHNGLRMGSLDRVGNRNYRLPRLSAPHN